MKKILFINHSNKIAGAETVLLKIIEIIAMENKEYVHVVAPVNTLFQTSFKKKLDCIGIKNYFRLPYKNMGVSLLRSFFVLIFNLYAVFRLILYITQNGIDVIYSNTSVTCIGVLTAMLMNKSHIWHFHESTSFENYLRDKKLRMLYKFLINYKNNTIIFISQIQKKDWEQFLFQEVNGSEIIYNPIKNVDFSISCHNSSDLVFGYLGSLSKRKNITLMINAFFKLRETIPNIKLFIGGNGPEMDRILKLIKQYSLDFSVILLGQINDVSEFYASIDIFILPSLAECWPLTVIEAIMAKKAVIITQNMGLQEVLEDKKDCVFFDPNNVDELFFAMKTLLNNEYRVFLADNAYKKISQYKFNQKFAETIISIFKK
jgi:glycosyltransferase involved in cell wall biosynthesis